MLISQLLIFSYISTAIGIGLVTIDLRTKGLRTLTAVKNEAGHVSGVFIMLGATAVFLGLMGALFANVLALRDNPPMMLAAIPVYVAFFWGCRTLSV